MLGTKIYKENFDQDLYSKCAVWCTANLGKIVEHDKYYEVVDNHPTQEQLKQQEQNKLARQLNAINYNIALMQGISVSSDSMDDEQEFAVIKGGELITLTETEFNNYFNELMDKRSTIISKLKAVK